MRPPTRAATKLPRLFRQLLPLSFALLALSRTPRATCEAKEFDWGDLGVAIGAKPALGPAGSNLRILVSPQRRSMSKSYELDYTNASQPALQGETSYVIPGSSGASYTSTGQLSSSIAGPSHSSAYSALSASIASLRNRLNARGVTFGESNYSQPLQYTNPSGSSYSAYADSAVSAQPQLQIQTSHLTGHPATYSVAGPSENGASVASQAAADNKTIVLAIPAKINFLPDNRGQSSQGLKQHPVQSQLGASQPQQLTILQSNGDNQAHSEYSSVKQYSGPESGEQMPSTQIEHEQHHQYVIVNSPAGGQPVEQAASPGVYTSSQLYQPNQAQTIKYIPAYQTSGQAQVQQVQTSGQKLYTGAEQTASNYETEFGLAGYSSRPCLDTCNSADPRWRRYSVSKYRSCCSRSSQFDPSPYEHPSGLEKSAGGESKFNDDAYYSYLYRKSRGRRSRALPRKHYSNRYSAASDDSLAAPQPESMRMRNYQPETSAYMRYYKSRQQAAATSEAATDGASGSADYEPRGQSKYSRDQQRSYRRGRGKEPEAPLAENVHEEDAQESPRMPASSSNGYGAGEYSVADGGRYPAEQGRSLSAMDEEDSSYEESADSELSGKPLDDYNSGDSNDGSMDEPSGHQDQPEPMVNKYRSTSSRRRNKSQVRSKKGGAKDNKQRSKGRKSYRYSNKQEQSSQANGTDYQATQPGGEQPYHLAEPNQDEEQASAIGYSAGKAESSADQSSSAYGGDSERDLAKYRASLNDSAVANLSKTTMHLKEILSILEKKAQLRVNESISGTPSSTPTPVTTMAPAQLYPMSLFGGASSLSSLTPDFLSAADFGLKSPYTSSLTSSLNSPASLSSLSSALSSLTPEAISTLSSYGSSHYSLPGPKHLSLPTPPHPRKRRINKVNRYSGLNVPKHHALGPLSSSLLNSAYYSSLAYPYWYPRLPSSVTNSYPYRNLSKPPYAPRLNSAMSSKLASAPGSPYSDERIHGYGNYDPIATVASSLRPVSIMRLRSKPFVLPPQVLPVSKA